MSDVRFRLKRVDADKPAVWAAIVAMDATCFKGLNAPALTDNSGTWWIAYAGDEIAGFCGIQAHDAETGYLCRAGVLPKFRGCGLQKQMIRKRLQYARTQEAWNVVVTDTTFNPASSNALISCGFRMFTPAKKWAWDHSCYWRKFLLARGA